MENEKNTPSILFTFVGNLNKNLSDIAKNIKRKDIKGRPNKKMTTNIGLEFEAPLLDKFRT